MKNTNNKQYKNLGNSIREAVHDGFGTGLLSLENEDATTTKEEELIAAEAYKFKSSFEQRKTAVKLATQLSRQIGSINLPDPDAVRYERPGNDWKKDEARATKQLDKIISLIESLSKLVSKSTL